MHTSSAVLSINHSTWTVTVHGEDNLDLGSSVYAGAFWERTSEDEAVAVAQEIGAILTTAGITWTVEWP